MFADIMNVYIKAQNKEKIWTKCGGPEFGDNHDWEAIVVRAFCGFKSARFTWKHMKYFGYTSNQADPNLCMRVCTRSNTNKHKNYYFYVLLNANLF